MGTIRKIGFQQREGELPGWQVYTELFEPEDVVYLELEGVQANVAMFADMEGRRWNGDTASACRHRAAAGPGAARLKDTR